MNVSATITVAAGDLHRLISDTAGFVSTDWESSALNAVHLSTAGGYLTAMGTNRLVAAWSRSKSTARNGFHAGVVGPDISRWLTLLEADPTVQATVNSRIDGLLHTAKLTVGSESVTTGATIPLTVDFSELMAALTEPAPTVEPGMLVNPVLLAPFTDVAKSRLPAPSPVTYDEDGDPHFVPRAPSPAMTVAAVQGPRGPILRVAIGDDFIAALMGLKQSDKTWTGTVDTEGWLSIVALAKEGVAA